MAYNRTDPDITNAIQQLRQSQQFAEQQRDFDKCVSLAKRLNIQLPPDERILFVDKDEGDCEANEMWELKTKNTLGHKLKLGGPEWQWYYALAEKVEEGLSNYKHGKSAGRGIYKNRTGTEKLPPKIIEPKKVVIGEKIGTTSS